MIPDNYSQWEARDREQESWLGLRPVCCYCDEQIQHDHYFLINDEVICPDCLDSYFRKDVHDFAE